MKKYWQMEKRMNKRVENEMEIGLLDVNCRSLNNYQ